MLGQVRCDTGQTSSRQPASADHYWQHGVFEPAKQKSVGRQRQSTAAEATEESSSGKSITSTTDYSLTRYRHGHRTRQKRPPRPLGCRHIVRTNSCIKSTKTNPVAGEPGSCSCSRGFEPLPFIFHVSVIPECCRTKLKQSIYKESDPIYIMQIAARNRETIQPCSSAFCSSFVTFRLKGWRGRS